MRILTPLLAVSFIALTGGVVLADDSSYSTSDTNSSDSSASSTHGPAADSGMSASSDSQAGEMGADNSGMSTSDSSMSSDSSTSMSSTEDATIPGEAGTADTSTGMTTADVGEVSRGYLKTEGISVKPMLGVIAYQDNTFTDTSRAAGGIGVDWNMAKMFSLSPSVYLGPSTGFIYSHLGSATSNFFGSGADFVENQAGANLLIIPTNLKAGYNISDFYRVSVHGGANVVYRSIASSMQLGTDYNQDGSLWKYYPNVGIDLEAALGPNVSLALRPDVTFTTGDNFFTGMVALGINLA